MLSQGNHHMYPFIPHVNIADWPDPFALADGTRISAKDQWPAQARVWREQIRDMEYGGLPPEPDSVEVETLCHTHARTFPGTPNNWSYRLHCAGGARSFSFCVRLIFPRTSPGPFPVVVSGDGCWWPPSDDVIRRVLESGCALLIFNRTELVEDLGYEEMIGQNRRTGGLYDVYPGHSFGALAAWAWGYHRCVDFLATRPFIRGDQIAVTGHSRGGKAALLAGATDERIGLVNANASGAGGSSAFRYVGDGGETLGIVRMFPSWFGAALQPYFGREKNLPFDQHCLLATVAPRPLLLTYALDDRWSNPEGMVQCVWAAREVYQLLGRPENLAFHFRHGGHAHAAEDWDALLDFMGWKWRHTKPVCAFNKHPYDHLQPVFTWRCP